jgi:hypothetical protein
MFGFGNKNRRRVRNDTFGPSRLRNAALAGAGVLAWRWWRNRQSTSKPATNPDRSFTERSAGTTDTF